jgi:thiamine-phosphate pyrophosphorylase
LVAISGITQDRAPAVIGAGVDGIAVITAVSEAEDPKAAAAALRARVDAALAARDKGR